MHPVVAVMPMGWVYALHLCHSSLARLASLSGGVDDSVAGISSYPRFCGLFRGRVALPRLGFGSPVLGTYVDNVYPIGIRAGGFGLPVNYVGLCFGFLVNSYAVPNRRPPPHRFLMLRNYLHLRLCQCKGRLRVHVVSCFAIMAHHVVTSVVCGGFHCRSGRQHIQNVQLGHSLRNGEHGEFQHVSGMHF